MPAHWTGSEAPLPTTMREVEGVVEESIPDEEAMCDDAPVSNTQSEALGGVDWRERPVSAWYSAGGSWPAGWWSAAMDCWGWTPGRAPSTPAAGWTYGSPASGQAWTTPCQGLSQEVAVGAPRDWPPVFVPPWLLRGRLSCFLSFRARS